VGGVVEQVVHDRALDHASGVHHLHAVGDASDHAQVVGDHHHCRVEVTPDAVEHIEDLGLHGHVEGGGGLVGDQHVGIVGDRHRDHHTLTHAPGELVGVLARPLVGLRDADRVEQLDGLQRCLPLGDRLVGQDHLDDLIADAVHGVER
jgi:hypothetical protein